MAGTTRSYLVVYRGEAGVRVLGRLRQGDVAPNRNALDLYVSRLRMEGVETGEVVLVDDATGRELARRVVPPRRRRP
jgi:hypothetical protein